MTRKKMKKHIEWLERRYEAQNNEIQKRQNKINRLENLLTYLRNVNFKTWCCMIPKFPLGYGITPHVPVEEILSRGKRELLDEISRSNFFKVEETREYYKLSLTVSKNRNEINGELDAQETII